MARHLLITGATGKQGGAVINALANNPSFTILAVTRNAQGTGAKILRQKAKNIKIIEGDQDNVPALFQKARQATNGSGIWGVYSVQVSPGQGLKGVTLEGEIQQGKSMVDESVKAGVQHFVYSSVDRGGDEVSWTNPTPVPHFETKHQIEHHLKDKAGSMGWTILRPVAFMEGLVPGFGTKVFMAVLRDVLGDKPLQFVATKDIGVFAKMAFEDPAKFNHKAIGLAGDELNHRQISQVVKTTTGQSADATFWLLGYLLRSLVSEVRVMTEWFKTDGYGADIRALRKMHPGLMNMETWLAKESSFVKKK